MTPSSNKNVCDEKEICRNINLKNENNVNNDSKYIIKVTEEDNKTVKNTQKSAKEDINAKKRKYDKMLINEHNHTYMIKIQK